jgi:DNA-binding response OmpR family regulator
MQIGAETSRAVENKRIFVVDSDEIVRAALQFILHDENEAHELASVEVAFAMRAGRHVDLVLLGSEIVREKGFGVFKSIEENMPGVKILVVTEASSRDFAQACLKAGADGILLKPFTVESARQRVDAALGRWASSSMVPLAALMPR